MKTAETLEKLEEIEQLEELVEFTDKVAIRAMERFIETGCYGKESPTGLAQNSFAIAHAMVVERFEYHKERFVPK